MGTGADIAKGRLGIIAGSGLLPVYVADAARRAGEKPLIIALKNESDSRFEGFERVEIGVGDMAGLRAALARGPVDRVVLSGGVKRRPEWREIKPTFATLLKVPAVVRTLLSGGDDTVLQMVIRLIEAHGATVIGAHQVAPDLVSDLGPMGRVRPSDEDVRDIVRAAEAATALGALDVGQGAVSVGGRIVALEGVEGTDRMLARVAELRDEGRISARRKGVLVKMCKPTQDMRADLPTVGRSTILNAARAGLAGVAVEAGRALVLEREAMMAAADETGLFICGIDRGLEGLGL
ncbi:LpxI family protein [Gellertiella hungarica]|uniref:DUF1009 domain-containing protein n=1 Tax=Gellertiella hungarica TaxID=1572859 RepID=A0A7W6NKZ4_9HYPH|nr:hypothetical protein [Gellertiella hungarica]